MRVILQTRRIIIPRQVLATGQVLQTDEVRNMLKGKPFRRDGVNGFPRDTLQEAGRHASQAKHIGDLIPDDFHGEIRFGEHTRDMEVGAASREIGGMLGGLVAISYNALSEYVFRLGIGKNPAGFSPLMNFRLIPSTSSQKPSTS